MHHWGRRRLQREADALTCACRMIINGLLFYIFQLDTAHQTFLDQDCRRSKMGTGRDKVRVCGNDSFQDLLRVQPSAGRKNWRHILAAAVAAAEQCTAAPARRRRRSRRTPLSVPSSGHAAAVANKATQRGRPPACAAQEGQGQEGGGARRHGRRQDRAQDVEKRDEAGAAHRARPGGWVAASFRFFSLQPQRLCASILSVGVGAGGAPCRRAGERLSTRVAARLEVWRQRGRPVQRHRGWCAAGEETARSRGVTLLPRAV